MAANTQSKKSATGRFTPEERAAMRERAQELKAEASKADGTKEVLDKIKEMNEPDRSMAGKLHALVMSTAPHLVPRTWYGMPAYALDGDVVCFYKPAEKFKMRYAELGFSDKAKLDDGNMWPDAYALKKLTPAEETTIASLVRKAVS